MHSLGAVREAWGTVIKDHLKVQNWIQRDEQVEGRTKTASFTSTCFFIAFLKRTSESSLLLLNKKVFFTLIFWENTHLKKKKKSFGLFLNPLLWQDFHLKTRAVQNIERCNTEPNIKKRKQKNCRNLFFFFTLFSCTEVFPKTGKEGNGEPTLGIPDGDVKGDSAVLRLLPQLEWFSGADEVGWGVGRSRRTRAGP